MRNNKVSFFSREGYIQWQGSDAQRLLKEDIKAGRLEEYGKRKMDFWLSRPEYCDEFPLHVFRDKIKQHIGTKKYHHTLKVRGKSKTYKYSKSEQN